MKVKVINGFLDRDKGRIIEKDETVDLDENKAKELITLGLVTKISKKEENAAKKAAEEAAQKAAAEEEAKKAAEEAAQKAESKDE